MTSDLISSVVIADDYAPMHLLCCPGCEGRVTNLNHIMSCLKRPEYCSYPLSYNQGIVCWSLFYGFVVGFPKECCANCKFCAPGEWGYDGEKFDKVGLKATWLDTGDRGRLVR